MTEQSEFQALVKRTDAQSIAAAVAASKRGERSGHRRVAAAMAWAAYACPDATNAVFDNISSAWLGAGPTPEIPLNLPEAPLPDSFWVDYWKVVEGAKQGYDAINITVAVAALSASVHEDFQAIAENHARNHPGAAAALTRPVPGHTDVEALASCAKDSLGNSLHTMIVENGYDPEVLDRNELMLSALPPSLCYLNTRILQMHDVWHLVAGYTTSGSHEVAISSFQLAQFGHNYSSMFLAAVSTITYQQTPRGVAVLNQLIAEAWQHGRNTPAMMSIEWEEEWNNSLAAIRIKHQIPVYNSVLPWDMLETMAAAPLWKKLLLGFRLAMYNRQLRKEASGTAMQAA